MERINILISRYFDGEFHQLRMRRKASEQCMAEALGKKDADVALRAHEEIQAFKEIERRLFFVQRLQKLTEAMQGTNEK